MRLTDRPKTLAEMKPDVPWPDELQAVMDRALARDANERYQHANELGRDLMKAVQHMPMTVAAEMGTAVLGAVPPTRVAPGGGARGGDAAGAGGAGGTKVAAKEPAPVQAPGVPARSRSRMPILAGGGVVAVLIAGGAIMAIRNQKADAVTPDTARQVASSVPSGADTAPPLGTARPMNSGTADTGRRAKTSSGTRTGPSPVSRAGTMPPGPANGSTETMKPAFNAEAMFKRVEGLVASTESSDMQLALDALDAAMPRLTSHGDSVRALFLRASARGVLDGDNVRACAILNSILAQRDAGKHTQAARNAVTSLGCQ